MSSLWDTIISKGADAAQGVSTALQPEQPAGSPAMDLRTQHYQEFTQGLTDLGFAEWAAARQPVPVQQPAVQQPAAQVMPAQPDNRPRTPDFLYRGREQAR